MLCGPSRLELSFDIERRATSGCIQAHLFMPCLDISSQQRKVSQHTQDWHACPCSAAQLWQLPAAALSVPWTLGLPALLAVAAVMHGAPFAGFAPCTSQVLAVGDKLVMLTSLPSVAGDWSLWWWALPQVVWPMSELNGT